MDGEAASYDGRPVSTSCWRFSCFSTRSSAGDTREQRTEDSGASTTSSFPSQCTRSDLEEIVKWSEQAVSSVAAVTYFVYKNFPKIQRLEDHERNEGTIGAFFDEGILAEAASSTPVLEDPEPQSPRHSSDIRSASEPTHPLDRSPISAYAQSVADGSQPRALSFDGGSSSSLGPPSGASLSRLSVDCGPRFDSISPSSSQAPFPSSSVSRHQLSRQAETSSGPSVGISQNKVIEKVTTQINEMKYLQSFCEKHMQNLAETLKLDEETLINLSKLVANRQEGQRSSAQPSLAVEQVPSTAAGQDAAESPQPKLTAVNTQTLRHAVSEDIRTPGAAEQKYLVNQTEAVVKGLGRIGTLMGGVRGATERMVFAAKGKTFWLSRTLFVRTVISIQAAYRGFQARKWYHLVRRSTILCQRMRRVYRARKLKATLARGLSIVVNTAGLLRGTPAAGRPDGTAAPLPAHPTSTVFGAVVQARSEIQGTDSLREAAVAGQVCRSWSAPAAQPQEPAPPQEPADAGQAGEAAGADALEQESPDAPDQCGTSTVGEPQDGGEDGAQQAANLQSHHFPCSSLNSSFTGSSRRSATGSDVEAEAAGT